MRSIASTLLIAVLSVTWFGDSRGFAEDQLPHLVMLVAEREYQTEQSLERFSQQNLDGLVRTTIVTAAAEDRNSLDGIEAVGDADVLLVSVRRRTLPASQLELIRRHVRDGKPVIGIRTASHAFSLRNQPPPEGRAVWTTWDAEVFGGNYTNHYGNQLATTVRVEPEKASDPMLVNGLQPYRHRSGGSLYKVSPLHADATPFVFGEVEGHPAEPVAWTFIRSDGGKSFYTSLGHTSDFEGELLPQLLQNAIRWSL